MTNFYSKSTKQVPNLSSQKKDPGHLLGGNLAQLLNEGYLQGASTSRPLLIVSQSHLREHGDKCLCSHCTCLWSFLQQKDTSGLGSFVILPEGKNT